MLARNVRANQMCLGFAPPLILARRIRSCAQTGVPSDQVQGLGFLPKAISETSSAYADGRVVAEAGCNTSGDTEMLLWEMIARARVRRGMG